MKKYIIGALFGMSILFTGYAFAATQGASGLVFVDSINITGYSYIAKLYDKDTNTICYYARDFSGSSAGVGISCLKNN